MKFFIAIQLVCFSELPYIIVPPTLSAVGGIKTRPRVLYQSTCSKTDPFNYCRVTHLLHFVVVRLFSLSRVTFLPPSHFSITTIFFVKCFECFHFKMFACYNSTIANKILLYCFVTKIDFLCALDK